MDRDKLRNDLKDLKKEIGNLEDKDPKAAARLQDLAESIENALNEPDDDLINGIQGNIEQFEIEHPTISVILDRITTALSSMGI